ncbi:aminopeptidase N [Corallincola luteus]|uniref:Aminopeptidase N n=1 Tax=Corallincola luteus TaxID=1775177 RepID=A0ABY2AL30_9GAMM|nr:aminopeptidase N [Corallincola luteus]TCI03156.1 aminopeptidase N [Corallincola luteus]
MKTEQTPTVKRLVDYRPPNFTISTVELNFVLDESKAIVTNRMQVSRAGRHNEPLVLDGEGLTLVSLAIDGQPLPAERFQCSDTTLTISSLPECFEVTVVTEIDPKANTSLEGLYLSEGSYCTQCEAEGFRKITYYLDRPDVLAVFTTRIEADEKCSYLLSNGNKTEEGRLPDGRHYASWHDPHPKPCYLFALVAGEFDLLCDSYRTTEGRDVALQLFVDKGNKPRGEFALAALKRSMAWDEQRFGLAYDLDIYMVVAVDFFNMGAMENKGLNVFNSKYVLAEPQSATDTDYHNIEAVIGHEYFHNWTGNRVTCRDWFQLSLKEGLTVFRDQEFSADMGSPAVNRLQNVRVIQTQQFAEDAGPMAHPIRPAQVIEMNNFYTVTVYNKGSEVIRMIHTLLGEASFRKGMDLYFQRHDGQAVTCDDFVLAMEDASGIDLTTFRRWYSQSGTPEVTVTDSYDEVRECYTLNCTQVTPTTADQTEKAPQHIPLAIALYADNGEELPLNDQVGELQHSVLDFKQTAQTFEFFGIKQKPTPALLVNFSAPVKLHFDYTEADLAFLVKHASDAYVKWSALQSLLSEAIFAAEQKGMDSLVLSDVIIAACEALIKTTQLDEAIVAEILSVPSVATLIEQRSFSDISRLAMLRDSAVRCLGERLSDVISARLATLRPGPYQYEAKDVAQRSLSGVLISYLAAGAPTHLPDIVERFNRVDNMTEKLALLAAANHWQLTCKERLLTSYEAAWKHDPLVMDKWLSIQALSPADSAISTIRRLFDYEVFSFSNPNRVRALVGTFAASNPYQFHRIDGEGYKLLTEVVIKLNKLNPQVAARIITPLTQWKKMDATRQGLMKGCLQEVLALPELSKDLFEIVDKSLAQ